MVKPSLFGAPPKMTPAAQAIYDEAMREIAAGRPYQDDAGACWPPGMPRMMTSLMPFQFMQYPGFLMIVSGYGNEVRRIYLDGRPHTDPDIRVDTYNGDSIGWWEANTLVVDTLALEPKRHWVAQGVRVSEQFHIVERYQRSLDGKSLSIEFIMTDPVNWEGEWKHSLHYQLVNDIDAFEIRCLPDANDHLPGMKK